jgi:hypothetical protein
MISRHPIFQFLVMVFLFAPIFFLLDGHVFTSSDLAYSSHQKLMQLPLPLAVIFCLVGVFIFLRIERVRLSAAVIFAFYILTTFAILISGDHQPALKQEFARFILQIQFLLPMFGLAIGQSLGEEPGNKWRFEVAMLVVVTAIVPMQLLDTFLQGTVVLSPNLYFFSIYQQLEYVPTIMIAMYLLAATGLAGRRYYDLLLLLLAPLMGIYAAASNSWVVIVLLIGGLFAWMLLSLRFTDKRRTLAMAMLGLAITGMLAYVFVSNGSAVERSSGIFASNAQTHIAEGDAGTSKRAYYRQHLNDSTATLLLGHSERTHGNLGTSGYNYLLDMVYNFGIVAPIPLLYLLFYTLRRLWLQASRKCAGDNVAMLAGVVLYLVVVVNAWNVGLREPYPGIVTFFLWGVLLNQLSGNRECRNRNKVNIPRH